MASITRSPPMRTIIFQYQMEATQQEGQTEYCLGTHSSQAVKAFNWEKLATAASKVRNAEYKCSVIDKEFERGEKKLKRLLFTFPSEKIFYTFDLMIRSHTRIAWCLKHRKKQISGKRYKEYQRDLQTE